MLPLHHNGRLSMGATFCWDIRWLCVLRITVACLWCIARNTILISPKKYFLLRKDSNLGIPAMRAWVCCRYTTWYSHPSRQCNSEYSITVWKLP